MPLPYIYWWLMSSGQRATECSEPRNRIYDSLGGSDSINSIKGNIVIVKTSTSGIVTDVEERDITHIEWLVYQYVLLLLYPLPGLTMTT